ncbi:MAG TPA: adenylate/guanylate cyclase domain-containing protein, partial [Rhodopila sp.]
MADASEHSPSPPLERKLVTVLSADVAEYSRLMAEDEEQTLRIFRDHSQIFASLVGLYHGRIFNTAGDAILAEFNSAVEAVRCATEIQAALHTRNDQLPPARQVRFRIGINLGDVMVQNSDLLGDGVNVAARLQGAAEPGGICVSGSVYDQIRNKLSLTFEPMGERHFKNIPQPVRTFSITGSDDHGQLPSSKQTGRRGGLTMGAIAAALLLVAGAGGYAAYLYQHGQSLPAPAAKPATSVASAVPQPAKPVAAPAPTAAPSPPS